LHGYDAIGEYGPKEMPIVTRKTDSGKTIQILQRIDVYAVINGIKTAFEITLSFSNLELNLYKCLAIMKMDQVQIVYENSAGKDRAEKIVAQSEMPDDFKSRIKFTSIGDFL
jgi:hypothetical protein